MESFCWVKTLWVALWGSPSRWFSYVNTQGFVSQSYLFFFFPVWLLSLVVALRCRQTFPPSASIPLHEKLHACIFVIRGYPQRNLALLNVCRLCENISDTVILPYNYSLVAYSFLFFFLINSCYVSKQTFKTEYAERFHGSM